MNLSRSNIAILLLTTTLSSGVSRSSSAQTTDSVSARSPTPSTRSTPSLPKELEGKVAKLKKGQRAPMKGILMTRGTLALLLKNSERRIRAAAASTQLAVKNAIARVLAAEKSAGIEVEAARSRTEACLADALRRERIFESDVIPYAAADELQDYLIDLGVVEQGTEIFLTLSSDSAAGRFYFNDLRFFAAEQLAAQARDEWVLY